MTQEKMVYDRALALEAVARLRDSGAQVFIVATGGGAGVNDLIWQQPGISGGYIGYHFPYSPVLTNEFVGRNLKAEGLSLCGPEAALHLMHAAYFTAQRVATAEKKLAAPVIGVGLTAVTVTEEFKKGGTRVFAAVRTNQNVRTFHAKLEQGLLGRKGDGQVCDLVALNLALEAAALDAVPFASSAAELGLAGDGLDGTRMRATIPASVAIADDLLLDGAYIDEDGTIAAVSDVDFFDKVIFPGSYNPYHFGHDKAALSVMQDTGRKVVFEITADHAYKTATVEDVIRRTAQFRGRWPVILRRGAGLFVDKAAQYPGAHFLCGMDVAEKVLDKKYYSNSNRMLNAALLSMHERDVMFYVIDRRNADGTLKTRKDLVVPAGYESMFGQVSVHWDISSTDLRTART